MIQNNDTDSEEQKPPESQENNGKIIISLVQHQFDGECARFNNLRTKGTHIMTVTALIITASIAMLSLYIPIVEKLPFFTAIIFTSILFISWITLSIFSLMTLVCSIKSQTNIDRPHLDCKDLKEFWYEKEDKTLTKVFDVLERMIDGFRTQNNKISKENDKSMTLLMRSVICFIVFLSLCTIFLLHQFIFMKLTLTGEELKAMMELLIR